MKRTLTTLLIGSLPFSVFAESGLELPCGILNSNPGFIEESKLYPVHEYAFFEGGESYSSLVSCFENKFGNVPTNLKSAKSDDVWGFGTLLSRDPYCKEIVDDTYFEIPEFSQGIISYIHMYNFSDNIEDPYCVGIIASIKEDDWNNVEKIKDVSYELSSE